MSIVIQKTWGREEIIHNGDYCCKKLVYARPIASSLHFHNHKHETFVVATGVFDIDDGSSAPRRLYPGDFVVLPPKTPHRIRCIDFGYLVESSTHDDPQDCVRLVPSER